MSAKIAAPSAFCHCGHSAAAHLNGPCKGLYAEPKQPKRSVLKGAALCTCKRWKRAAA